MIRAAVRRDANQRFADKCGSVDLPDEAFLMVDVTGDGNPELAALFGLATCANTGAATNFAGTGGAIVQFWSLTEGRPKLRLEEMVHGYTPTIDGLLTFQHGSFCGNFSGASLCVTAYRWDSARGELHAVDQRVYDDAHPGEQPTMEFDWAGPARR